jgi:hypothetical protein
VRDVFEGRRWPTNCRLSMLLGDAQLLDAAELLEVTVSSVMSTSSKTISRA